MKQVIVLGNKSEHLHARFCCFLAALQPTKNANINSHDLSQQILIF